MKILIDAVLMKFLNEKMARMEEEELREKRKKQQEKEDKVIEKTTTIYYDTEACWTGLENLQHRRRPLIVL